MSFPELFQFFRDFLTFLNVDTLLDFAIQQKIVLLKHNLRYDYKIHFCLLLPDCWYEAMNECKNHISTGRNHDLWQPDAHSLSLIGLIWF